MPAWPLYNAFIHLGVIQDGFRKGSRFGKLVRSCEGSMFSDKAPYLVTLVVAGIAWTVTHIVDSLLASPVLVYRTQILESGGKTSFYLTLKNITRDKTFRDVRLIISADPGDLLSDGAVIPIQPAWEGDTPGNLAGRTFEYTFAEFQPGWQFEISAVFKGPKRPTFRIAPRPDEAVRAVPSSIETILVENEIPVLASMLIGWIILLVVAVLGARSSGQNQYDT